MIFKVRSTNSKIKEHTRDFGTLEEIRAFQLATDSELIIDFRDNTNTIEIYNGYRE